MATSVHTYYNIVKLKFILERPSHSTLHKKEKREIQLCSLSPANTFKYYCYGITADSLGLRHAGSEVL